MKRQHQRPLERIFSHPVSANIKWKDIEALLNSLGAELIKREGSRVEVFLFNEVRIYHRPHLRPDKGALANIKKWLKENEVLP